MISKELIGIITLHTELAIKQRLREVKEKRDTKKWNGIAKSEGQFKEREAIFIDLNRIVPARFYSPQIFSLSHEASIQEISPHKATMIEGYISHVLEEQFTIKKLATHLDKDVYKYSNDNEYSSYNTASGEDVLTKMIIDIVECPEKSLILIDEIEMGLHPKTQRRVMDVLKDVSRKEKKQFIITTHSGTILDSLPDSSRIFLEKDHSGQYRAIQNISVNAALSKMDSKSFPLVDLYCEDDLAESILKVGISKIQSAGFNNFSDLVNIIQSGSANDTYQNFKVHERTYSFKKNKVGFACALDGDMRLESSGGAPMYPSEELLHFIFPSQAPEKHLTKVYLDKNPNRQIEFHLLNSNPHVLFQKILENSALSSIEEVQSTCMTLFEATPEGQKYFAELTTFLMHICKKFSPDL